MRRVSQVPPRSTPTLDLRDLPPDAFRPLPRHRHGLSREQVQAAQAGRIILATAEVISERGYAATTVIDIAKRAGVSRKTFYELFADKEEAFLAAYTGVSLLVEHTAAALDAQPAAGSDPRELALAGTTALLGTLAEHAALTRMFFLEALGAGPRIQLRRDAAIEQFTVRLTPVLAELRAAERPDLEPIDHALARAMIGASVEAIVRHLVHHPPETLGDLAPELAHLFLRILVPAPATRS